MAVVWASTWQVKPGRGQDWLELAGEAKTIQERLGATVRHLHAMYAGEGGGITYIYGIESADLAAHGAMREALNADEEWQTLVPKLLGPDAPASIVASSLLEDA